MKGIEVNEYRQPTICPVCGTQFTFKGVGEYVCDRCGRVEYDDYGIVRNYIETHKGATVVEISAATGISQSVIHSMLREERLQVASDSRVFLKCKACGKDITSGMYCPACAKLAQAAELRRKAAAERAARQQQLAGYASDVQKGEEGAKRFRRDW